MVISLLRGTKGWRAGGEASVWGFGDVGEQEVKGRMIQGGPDIKKIGFEGSEGG